MKDKIENYLKQSNYTKAIEYFENEYKFSRHIRKDPESAIKLLKKIMGAYQKLDEKPLKNLSDAVFLYQKHRSELYNINLEDCFSVYQELAFYYAEIENKFFNLVAEQAKYCLKNKIEGKDKEETIAHLQKALPLISQSTSKKQLSEEDLSKLLNSLRGGNKSTPKIVKKKRTMEELKSEQEEDKNEVITPRPRRKSRRLISEDEFADTIAVKADTILNSYFSMLPQLTNLPLPVEEKGNSEILTKEKQVEIINENIAHKQVLKSIVRPESLVNNNSVFFNSSTTSEQSLTIEAGANVILDTFKVRDQGLCADIIRELGRFCRKEAMNREQASPSKKALLFTAKGLFLIANAWGNTNAMRELQFMYDHFCDYLHQTHKSTSNASSGKKVDFDTFLRLDDADLKMYHFTENLFEELLNNALNEIDTFLLCSGGKGSIYRVLDHFATQSGMSDSIKRNMLRGLKNKIDAIYNLTADFQELKSSGSKLT